VASLIGNIKDFIDETELEDYNEGITLCADKRIPQTVPFFYFEIRIENIGPKNGYICI